MKLLYRHVTMLILALVGRTVLGSPLRRPIVESARIYSKLCQGEFDEFNKETKLVSPDKQYYLKVRLMALSTKEGEEEALVNYGNYSGKISSLPEADRVVYAAALLISMPKSPTKIKDLLNFISQNKIVEAYREYVESVVDSLEWRWGDAFLKEQHAFNLLPYFDESILAGLYRLAISDKYSKVILGPYFKYIDRLSDRDGTKYYLLGLKTIAISDWQNNNEYFSNISKAYKLCRYDFTFATIYATYLFRQGDYDLAEKIYLEQVKIRKFYPPYIDLNLASMYSSQHNYKEAKVFIRKARENKNFLPVSMRKQFRDLYIRIEFYSALPYLIGCLCVLIILAYLGLIIKRRQSLR